MSIWRYVISFSSTSPDLYNVFKMRRERGFGESLQLKRDLWFWWLRDLRICANKWVKTVTKLRTHLRYLIRRLQRTRPGTKRPEEKVNPPFSNQPRLSFLPIPCTSVLPSTESLKSKLFFCYVLDVDGWGMCIYWREWFVVENGGLWGLHKDWWGRENVEVVDEPCTKTWQILHA